MLDLLLIYFVVYCMYFIFTRGYMLVYICVFDSDFDLLNCTTLYTFIFAMWSLSNMRFSKKKKKEIVNWLTSTDFDFDSTSIANASHKAVNVW